MSKPNLFVRIPGERVGVLIGPEGKVKRDIEERLQVKLEIESEGGGVNVMLDEKASDPSKLLRAKDVVSAVGRGFAPDQAFRLVRSEEMVFDFIDLRQIFDRSESDIRTGKIKCYSG